jgi:signal transduction histidine kinase
MRTLRGRLIVSHILPLLLILPLIGIALIYIVETQVLLVDIADELMQHGALSAEYASDQPIIWSDDVEARRFVTLFSVRSRSHVMLLDAEGNLLASSDPMPSGQLDQAVDMPYLAGALAGEQQVHVTYTQNIHAEIVRVLVPVVGPGQNVVGVVRMIGIVLGVGMVLAAVVGLLLALNLGRSLRQVTEAIYGVASGREWKALPEQDPEEIRLLLRAFNTLIERLRVLEESRRRLLANLVHELGRPIGALQSALQALLSGADQDPELRQELLTGMDAQVQRLRPLLDSLTDLHSQVLGTLELNRTPTALGEWLPRTVMPWRQAAHDQGLHWRSDIPDDLPTVEIDPDRMAQVLGNLLSNAVKYTPEGTISVEAAAREGHVAIVVGDSGIGIAPSEQEQIFEPFYRSQRDKRFPQGMGLGLSIARDLVLAHGGRLQVNSAPGEGSRFTILLPSNSPRLSLRAEATERQRRGRSEATPNPSAETNPTRHNHAGPRVISSAAKHGLPVLRIIEGRYEGNLPLIIRNQLVIQQNPI